jgi:hypothetical protein
MNKVIKIEYDDCEDMNITLDGVVVFGGNSTDFERDPIGISSFLEKLGFVVNIEEKDAL